MRKKKQQILDKKESPGLKIWIGISPADPQNIMIYFNRPIYYQMGDVWWREDGLCLSRDDAKQLGITLSPHGSKKLICVCLRAVLLNSNCKNIRGIIQPPKVDRFIRVEKVARR